MPSSSNASTLDAASPLDDEPFLNILKFPGHEPTYLFNPLEFDFQEDIHANSNCVVKSYLFKPYNNFHVVVKAIQIPHSRNIIQKSQNEKRLKQLIDEVRNFRRLPQHPYIVDFYGFCRHEGQARIVMEHMDLSLEELYNYVHGYNQILPKVPEDIIGVIAHRILDALAFCKDHNIIHRDVKPRNVLLTLNGNVKLCDFGESRVLQ
uniref:mitogen-activated protein kinase kinase n=1 Tax=Acrobeloides nanus TaxID=290746 RepID=A0A914EG14_9BILA